MNFRGIRMGALGLGMALIVTQGPRAEEVVKPLPVTEFLIADRQKDLGLGQTFRDTAGQLWRTTDSRLLRWDGKARTWEQTPVLVAPRPHWAARSTPPWHGWNRPPRIVVGENGSLLAVVVRDVFQEIDTEKLEDGMGSWQEVLRQGQELAEKRGHKFWLDARLYRDGKWSEARALEDLLVAEREFLVKSFPGQTPDFSFFDMQVSGTELWWSDGTVVHVLDADGRHAAWALPDDEDSSTRGHLHSVNLLRPADGVIWCVDGANVYSLKCEKGRIAAAARPEAKLPGSPHWPNRHLYAVQSGSLWYWFSNTSGAGTWTLHEGTWEKSKGLGLFLREDSDGTLWFLPGDGEGSYSWKGYNLVTGNKRLRLPMPGDFPKGHVANVDKDRLLATGGDRVFLLVRTAEEPGWRVKDVVGLKETYENGQVWLDRKGNLVGQSGWSAKLPEDKFKDWSTAVAEK